MYNVLFIPEENTSKEKSGKSVKDCLSVSLICLSESVRRGPILSGCDSKSVIHPLLTESDMDRLWFEDANSI